MKVPSVEEYVTAFENCEKPIKGRVKLLLAHYNSLEKTTTMTELSRMVGYNNFESGNLHYGKLARIICEDMNRKPGDIYSGTDCWIVTLVRFRKRPDDKHIKLIMHDNVAEAISRLGWATPR